MNIDRSLDQHSFECAAFEGSVSSSDFWKITKIILACLCLATSLCGLVAIGVLAYSYWETYQQLQASNASGSEYLPLVMAPGMFATLFAISGIAFACWRKLLQKRSAVGDILGIVFLFGFGLSLCVCFVIVM